MRQSKSTKILHIDDNEMTRYTVSKLLKRAGYEVVNASTGKDGLDAVLREQPALVLLDVNLPDISGYEVCRRVKALPGLSSMPVLHMSASFVKSDDQVRGLMGGADGYITEPIEPDVLLATINAALRVRAAEQECSKAQRSAEEAQARLKVLADVGHLLSETKNPEAVLDRIVSLLTPAFADAATIILFDERGQAEAMSSAHVEPHRASVLSQILNRYPPDLRRATNKNMPEEAELVAPVTDQFLMSFSRDGEHFMLLKSLGATSCIVANMTANGRKLGVLVLATVMPERTFSQQDVNFASELTRRMAIVIDNVRLLRQAQQNNRMKDEFLASLAHELRNPLAPIRNATQLMGSKLNEPETIDKLRMMIGRQVHHISRMIDDLTDVARIENGKLILRRETVDLVSVVRDAIHSCKELIEQKHQNLVLELPRKQLYMNGDPTRLEQVVCNLIHNAAKYTPELGTVTVHMEGYAESIIVRIKDNGIGISSRLLPRIFDLFTQAPQSLDRPQGGLGIGLTIVRHLVSLHGGSISARSDGEGKGSEFTLRFPMVNEPSLIEQKTSAAPASTAKSQRVLIIEDNCDIRETMTLLLKSWGHEIKHAGNGDEALATMRGWKPDVVLLDIGLPGNNGFRVAQMIRAVPEWKDIYLVAATGYSSPRDKQMARECGFNTLMVKPLELEKLKELLNRPPSAHDEVQTRQ